MADEMLAFLAAVVVGALLGAVYDFFRILRLVFKSGKIICFIEDILFFIIAGMSTLAVVIVMGGGLLRWFLLFGELLGGILYFFTISVVVMKIMKAVVGRIKKALAFIYKKVLSKPISALKKLLIANKIALKCKYNDFLHRKLKKSSKDTKNY